MGYPYSMELEPYLDERRVRIDNIADDYVAAWVHGKPARIETYRTPETLASLVADDLCDVPGNAVHELIALVGDMARAGNARAMALINRMAWEHATSTVEMQDMTP